MQHPVVAIALSGGIDSLVAGFLLKQRFRNVFGVHFRTGYEKHPLDTALLEDCLGFSVVDLDLAEVFEKKVVAYFVSTYLNGKTPNPCVICNREIKFGELMDQVLSRGADLLATGHYASVVNPFTFPERYQGRAWLERGRDPLKDQSYFLSMVPADRLERVIFPLADMTKERVRDFAGENRITALHAKESQDICFVRDTDASEFILQKSDHAIRPGPIVNTEGNTVGRHDGLHRYTVGQRRGINVPAREAYYVKRVDMAHNVLEVCFRNDLSSRRFNVEGLTLNDSNNQRFSDVLTRVRYSHKGGLSTLICSGSQGEVVFHEPQRAVTPGQTAVFYKGSRVLGAGFIQ